MKKKINNNFKFNKQNILKAKSIIAKYPKKFQISATIPLLHLVQVQLDGWISKSSIEYISKFLKIPLIRVYEVAGFYHMFNLKKVGNNCIHVCTTTSCWLRGSNLILKEFEKNLKIKVGETTNDNLVTLKEIECLGACINAPVVKINNDFCENLKLKDVKNLINKLTSRKKVLINKNA
tara:strand:+ start:1510 stop:2043 length:534 start_codon:yes stop_codon:yes gene_type:complete